MRRMWVRAGDVELVADLRTSPTADALWDLLPVTSRSARWGDEFYFRVEALLAEREPDARDQMEVGEIGYWVEGQAVAVFFGPTPASREGEPRAIVPVNVVGRLRGDARALARLDDGVTFHLEPIEQESAPERRISPQT